MPQSKAGFTCGALRNDTYPKPVPAGLHHEAMEKLNRDPDNSTDLARRLARYRRRVAAEGRARSLRLIDRAIVDAAGND